jgi:hypothetical protein
VKRTVVNSPAIAKKSENTIGLASVAKPEITPGIASEFIWRWRVTCMVQAGGRMKSLYIFVFAVCLCSYGFSEVALAENAATTGSIQTGFVVVTPLSGAGAGLHVSEIFSSQVGNSFFQSSVVASPQVTFTSVVVSCNANIGIDTGISIVNPNSVTARLTVTVRNQSGIMAATRSIVIAPRQQVSTFVSELFAGQIDCSGSFTGLLFISSNVPIAVVGFVFNGPSFISLPVTQQLSVNVIALVNPSPLVNPSLMPLVPSTITQIPPTFPSLVTPESVMATTVPLGTPTGLVTTTSNTGGVAVFNGAAVTPTPLVINSILLPQIAFGGGWTTHVNIANASPNPQIVRVDFFNSSGAPMVLPAGSSLPRVLIPPGGVVTVSTDR